MLKFYVSLLLLGGLVLGIAPQANAVPEIIGAPKCKGCHKAKTGDQWKIWTESAHARAFETLASEKSKNIAKEKGLGDPQTEDACLKCHATKSSLGAGVVVNQKGKYADTEGVGCESCHGPGSDYKSKKVMVDPEAARGAGLIMIGSAEGCTHCHNEESPTFKGFDFEPRWAEIAHPVPLQEKAPPEEKAPSGLLTEYTDMPDEITYESSVGKVLFPHNTHAKDHEIECVECHHQIHAEELVTPHAEYLTSSWIKCQICHNPDSAAQGKYYKCSDCHHSEVDNIADETLSSKVVTHKSCWACHETETGVGASKGCVDCHVKEER
jgi:hypothetical protein